MGATGSGKTDLAHEVACRRNGEIVSADAFAVYRGFDVGTAKPSAERRRQASYHLVDVAEPEETFSAGRWAAQARPILEEIDRRGRLPIVCGGSGFYVSALFETLPASDALEMRLRPALARWGRSRPAAAHKLLRVNDPVSAERIPISNVRYTLRALEIVLSTGRPVSQRGRGGDRWAERWRTIRLGLAPERDALYATIAGRVRQMMEAGWEGEVRRLLEQGVSPESNGFRAIGYREITDWVEGRAGRAETERKIVTATRQLAKRQRTWFARVPGIEWVRPEDALALALARLDQARAEGSG